MLNLMQSYFNNIFSQINNSFKVDGDFKNTVGSPLLKNATVAARQYVVETGFCALVDM